MSTGSDALAAMTIILMGAQHAHRGLCRSTGLDLRWSDDDAAAPALLENARNRKHMVFVNTGESLGEPVNQW
jgi:hypothetical protein